MSQTEGMRRRLNSDISDMQELASRNTSISTIYGHKNSEDQSKIVDNFIPCQFDGIFDDFFQVKDKK